MEIVSYKREHAEACLNIFKSNQAPYFANDEYEQYERYLRNKALIKPYYVVEEGGNLLAAGGYELISDAVWLDWGMVRRDRHGSGIGTFLLNYRIEEIIQKHSGVAICLCTSQHSVGFYEKYGFVQKGFEENGYTKGLHKIKLVYENC